jgi:hypothetical protein
MTNFKVLAMAALLSMAASLRSKSPAASRFFIQTRTCSTESYQQTHTRRYHLPTAVFMQQCGASLRSDQAASDDDSSKFGGGTALLIH